MKFTDIPKVIKRMCDNYESCATCPLRNYDSICSIDEPEAKAIEKIVEEWAINHPIPTNREKFIEKFGEETLRTILKERQADFLSWLDEEYIEP